MRPRGNRRSPKLLVDRSGSGPFASLTPTSAAPPVYVYTEHSTAFPQSGVDMEPAILIASGGGLSLLVYAWGKKKKKKEKETKVEGEEDMLLML